MITLSTGDRRDVIELLTRIPEFESPAGRRALLDVAGLGALTSRIDLGGPAFLAAHAIVSQLAAFGQVSSGQEALGVFLNAIQPLIGVDQRPFLTDLLIRYSMLPESELPAVAAWRGHDDSNAFEEKIIDANTLRPIGFLTQALRASRAVAYLEISSGGWSGTGFLVSEDLLMTNFHVLPRPELLDETTVMFNYESDEKGTPKPPVAFRARGAEHYWANSKLDYAVFEVAGNPGKDWGWLSCALDVPSVGERVNIIQHPGGQQKQIAMQGNFLEYADDSVVQYVTATLPGSSGSPVFSDHWLACAVHHAGGTIPEPTTGRRHFRNEGIRLSRIREDLVPEVSTRLTWI
jgi:V8-like Glu-specific endopeptidase